VRERTIKRHPAVDYSTPSLFDQPQTTDRTHNRDPLLAAEEWVESNNGPWRRICHRAINDINVRRRVSFKRYVEMERAQDDINPPIAHHFKIDNTVTAGLSRLFCRQYPHLADHVPQRASRADR